MHKNQIMYIILHLYYNMLYYCLSIGYLIFFLRWEFVISLVSIVMNFMRGD